MDIHQLELFLAVLEASSMTRAAEKFYLSPAAVSFQMHNLALELNTELFVREGKKVNPTPAALRLAEHARSILKLTGQIKQEFDDDPSKDSRPFHFATGVTTLIYQLGKPLRLLRKQYPTADIRVTVGVTEEIVAGLNAGLAQYEKLKKLLLVPDEFSVATGELTPSMKLKRRVVEQKYKAAIEALYSEERVPAPPPG